MSTTPEQLSENARQVLAYSQEESRRFNHNYVGSEHLLLGLLRGEDTDHAKKALTNLGIDLNKGRSAVEFILGRGERTVIGNLGLTPRAKKIIELAFDESKMDGVSEPATTHLLRGLIRENEGIGAAIIESLGVSFISIQEELIRLERPPKVEAQEEELSPEEQTLNNLKAIFENKNISDEAKKDVREMVDKVIAIFIKPTK